MKVLTVDPAKCSGAAACATACAQTLFKTDDRAFSSIQVLPVGGKPRAVACDQCGECVAVCPTRALYRAKSGVVLLKKDACVGCLMCIGFCPTAAMFKAPRLVEPVKCISCGNCVEACPTGALAMVQKDHAGLPA